MDYAVNKITNKVESAESVVGGGFYSCPICQARVSHRAGLKRKKYFAHWPGTGTAQCENFAPGLYGQNLPGGAFAVLTKRRMELRLRIDKGRNRAAWYLELTLPSCRACNGTITVDVGGRLQNINMLGMASGSRITAELSTDNFRIVSFDGQPDRYYVESVERECRGLPSLGAAVFTASGRGDAMGFPRAHELRGAETYALLWKEPVFPDFPSELVPDRFQSRRGWSLALITVPEDPSEECTDWLQAFTGLIVNPPVPSITTVWPFLARNASVNAIECIDSSSLILAANMMPVGPQDAGPSMLVFGGANRIAAIGVERSPALFTLTPGSQEHFRVAKSETSEAEKFFFRTLKTRTTLDLPGLEMAFTSPEGVHLIVPFGTRKCKALVELVRLQQMTLDYLAMPPGATGRLHSEIGATPISVELSSGDDLAPHSSHQRLLPNDAHCTVLERLRDSSSHVDLEFGGFGRLRCMGVQSPLISKAPLMLNHSVRSRVRSFLSQLLGSGPMGGNADDAMLVLAFYAAKPQSALLPNYRVLAREILASGFEVTHSGEGVSS
ncbi:competence protein CoiA family protein [Pseudomonas graminis]|uniref:Uncharacterized protein n=1 Tax=Pseudomonas graminis TaxID=158627 RepID=A0A1I0HB48_9PSED|nr:hypothetical protein [Pseudomonas graminis]SET80865.1 hypothetical protein SAMN05216197_12644 [Pseudomonas graminis]